MTELQFNFVLFLNGENLSGRLGPSTESTVQQNMKSQKEL